MKKPAKTSMDNLKGKKIPSKATKDQRPPESKPRKSGKGGVGSGSGIPGPGTLSD